MTAWDDLYRADRLLTELSEADAPARIAKHLPARIRRMLVARLVDAGYTPAYGDALVAAVEGAERRATVERIEEYLFAAPAYVTKQHRKAIDYADAKDAIRQALASLRAGEEARAILDEEAAR